MMKKLLLLLSLCSFNTVATEIEVPQFNDALKHKMDTQTLLTLNLYHEARSQSDVANMMILSVVFNRVEDSRFPNTVEGVVKDRKAFSWLTDGRSDKVYEPDQYKRLYKLVEKFLMNKQMFLDMSQGVDHYHATRILPYWAESGNMYKQFRIDDHIFYSWR